MGNCNSVDAQVAQLMKEMQVLKTAVESSSVCIRNNTKFLESLTPTPETQAIQAQTLEANAAQVAANDNALGQNVVGQPPKQGTLFNMRGRAVAF